MVYGQRSEIHSVPASAGGRGGILTSVGWQVTLCDPIWLACEFPVAVNS